MRTYALHDKSRRGASRAAGDPQRSVPHAPPIVREVLSSPGRALDPPQRRRMESHFRHDFSRVRVHSDARAAESVRAVDAKAYSVGEHVAFGEGRYDDSYDGRRLLAHELTHVVEHRGKGGAPLLHRSAIAGPEQPPMPVGKTPARTRAVRPPAPPQRRVETIPAPETCPAPQEMQCPEADSSPGAVTNTLIFPSDGSTLTPVQRDEVNATAAGWRAAGGSVQVRVDGYASAEGPCTHNWNLSCRRAQAVKAALERPSNRQPGVPSGNIEIFAHGESDEAGRALTRNRRATISIPVALTPPAPEAVCPMPVKLGDGRAVGRRCGASTDFGHFDFPSITLGSEIKLQLWARSHGRLTRWLIPNFECEAEMDSVLSGLAGGAGHAAFTRFAAGTAGVETHDSSSTLGALALASPEFGRTRTAVQTAIETQLGAQAAGGAVDPCGLAVTPPPTSFASRHFYSPGALKTVIGGTQGEELWATSFTGSASARTYSINLMFFLCDDFGVDEADLYAPGLMPFWVLQHERSASRYKPFINLLSLPVTLTGTF